MNVIEWSLAKYPIKNIKRVGLFQQVCYTAHQLNNRCNINFVINKIVQPCAIAFIDHKELCIKTNFNSHLINLRKCP